MNSYLTVHMYLKTVTAQINFDVSILPFTAPAPLNCTFETGLCGWENDGTAETGWIRWKGATPSIDTGPDQAANGTYYMYMEASDPTSEKDTARLISPSQVASPTGKCERVLGAIIRYTFSSLIQIRFLIFY